MPTTYEPIATTTLGSAQATITFSSISASYTDLKLVLHVSSTSSAGQSIKVNFNSDTGTNYSFTRLQGNGTAASSGTLTARNYAAVGFNSTTSTTLPTSYQMEIFSYAGSTFKTALGQGAADQNGSGVMETIVNLWRSTSAINRLDIAPFSGNFNSGTTATIYGILKA